MEWFEQSVNFWSVIFVGLLTVVLIIFASRKRLQEYFAKEEKILEPSKDLEPSKILEPSTTLNFPQRKAGLFNILIIDDNQLNLELISDHLGSMGYGMTLCSNGVQGLSLVEKEKPTLVLLDVMMPLISGFEVCHQIRQKFSLEELPILFLTAKDKLSDLVQAYEIGCNDYLTKPFHKEELLVRVRNLLNLSQEIERINSLNRISRKAPFLQPKKMLAFLREEFFMLEVADEVLIESKGTRESLIYQVSSGGTENKYHEVHLGFVHFQHVLILRRDKRKPAFDKFTLLYLEKVSEEMRVQLELILLLSNNMKTLAQYVNSETIFVQSHSHFCTIVSLYGDQIEVDWDPCLIEICYGFLVRANRRHLVNVDRIVEVGFDAKKKKKKKDSCFVVLSKGNERCEIPISEMFFDSFIQGLKPHLKKRLESYL